VAIAWSSAGKKRPEDAEETVEAHLRHHRREEHRHAGRRFGVGGREPGMKGEERNFDREAEQHSGEDEPRPGLAKLRGEGAVGAQRGELGEIERADGGEERGEAGEHERAATDRVDDKLIRGAGGGGIAAGAGGAAPEFDEEEGGNEAEFPEDEPVEEIEREEDAERGALEKKEEKMKSARIAGFVAGSEERQRRDDAGEQHQQQTQAVEAEMIADVERRDPGVAFDELQAGRGRVEGGQEGGGDEQRREAEAEGDVAGAARCEADNRQDGGADPGDENREGEKRERGHRAPPITRTTARTTNATASVSR